MVSGIAERSVFDGFGRSAARSRSGPLTVVRNDLYPTGELRVAFAVPRRVGPAVIRNRLKRQLRSVVDSLSTERLLQGGTYLIIVGPGARGSTWAQLRTWMVDALQGLPGLNGVGLEN